MKNQNSESKIYYKVVSPNLESARASLLSYIWTVQYKIGEWVKPNVKDTKLMVFDKYFAAERFKFATDKIFKCEIKNGINFNFISNWMSNYSDYWDLFKECKMDFKKFKIRINRKMQNFELSFSSLEYMVMCDEIKLIEEIKVKK